ncbi:MAG: ABC transporter substrate-binding protein [Candidatus Latescibacterota bacterium]
MTTALTVGISTNDRMLPLLLGDVPTPGLDLTFDRSSPNDIFRRALQEGAFDVTEMSFAAHAILMSRGKQPFVGLPVFVSRMFRHGCVFVRSNSDIERPEDLAGMRIGIAEYQMTAVVWMRGILNEYHNVNPKEVRWVRGGVNSPVGRGEKIPLQLPEGYDITDLEDQSLNEALTANKIDALITTRLPTGLETGALRCLFPDVKRAERAYYVASGIFPIMHLLVLRREIYERNPTLARALYNCFSAARTASLKRLYDIDALSVMVPWLVPEMAQTSDLFGHDPWPYGLAANQREFEVFLAYLEQQELLEAPIQPKDLFVPELLGT